MKAAFCLVYRMAQYCIQIYADSRGLKQDFFIYQVKDKFNIRNNDIFRLSRIPYKNKPCMQNGSILYSNMKYFDQCLNQLGTKLGPPGPELGGSLGPAHISWPRLLGSSSGRGPWPIPCYSRSASNSQSRSKTGIFMFPVNL